MSKESDLKTLKEAEVTAADILAIRLAQRHTIAAIVLALAKRQALDLADVYAFVGTFANGFSLMSRTATDPLLARANEIAAEELAALEPMVHDLLTIPAGAGRA